MESTDTMSVCIQRLRPRWPGQRLPVLDMLRLDLLQEPVCGNKGFKLKYHLQGAREAGVRTIISFGGPWSNHLHALAAAGQQAGLATVGIVRGARCSTATLKDAQAWGMTLHFISRADYRLRHEPAFHRTLMTRLGYRWKDLWLVPEGGGGAPGIKGCEEILPTAGIAPCNYDQIWLACGTGATLAGVARAAGRDALVCGVAVLKGADFLRDDIARMLGGVPARWQLNTQDHCGGYGRTTTELLDFMAEFELDTGVPLDQVYTGKVMLALKKQLAAGQILDNSRLLVIHTGGLQGKRGLSEYRRSDNTKPEDRDNTAAVKRQK